MPKIVIAGPPCSGKSTIISEIKKLGHAVTDEVARKIIDEELTKSQENPNYTPIVPWTHLERFQDLVVFYQFIQEKEATVRPLFLDRSLVDPIAYASFGNVSYPAVLDRLIHEANYQKVFYLEQLPYVEDLERKETKEEALELHKHLLKAYKDKGFDLIDVPVLPIDERVQFIINKI